MSWLKHAFAIEPPGPAEPSATERDVVEQVCREVVRRQLTTPAVAFLEMSRPLNFLSAQVLHWFAPVVSILVRAEAYNAFAAFLERRGSIEYLCQRMEALEAESPT